MEFQEALAGHLDAMTPPERPSYRVYYRHRLLQFHTKIVRFFKPQRWWRVSGHGGGWCGEGFNTSPLRVTKPRLTATGQRNRF